MRRDRLCARVWNEEVQTRCLAVHSVGTLTVHIQPGNPCIQCSSRINVTGWLQRLIEEVPAVSLACHSIGEFECIYHLIVWKFLIMHPDHSSLSLLPVSAFLHELGPALLGPDSFSLQPLACPPCSPDSSLPH